LFALLYFALLYFTSLFFTLLRFAVVVFESVDVNSIVMGWFYSHSSVRPIDPSFRLFAALVFWFTSLN
jgi:hypothetical protein